MRAAVVGGTAYYAGKKVSDGRQAEADQNAQIADLQAQQQYQEQPQYAAPAPAAPAQEDPVEKLKQLKGLLDQGVLTQAEFDLEKQKILQNM
jgi:membrane protease subunit (stomatin/prohibitin family)